MHPGGYVSWTGLLYFCPPALESSLLFANEFVHDYHRLMHACEWCGKAFEEQPWPATRAKFCGDGCRYQAEKERRRLKRGYIWPKEIVCGTCNKVFSAKPWPNTRNKFCSRKCALKAHYLRHKDILAEKQKIRNTSFGRKSRLDVQRKWNSSERGRELKKQWYEKHREELFKKYLESYRNDPQVKAIHLSRGKARKALTKIRKKQCEACGVIMRRMDCHHKNENPLDNRIENLQWLCHSCHMRLHSEILG
jgi:hypothetical protein